MKKPISIQLSIPSPCTQSWNEMQPVAGGRYCVHCQQAVVDFMRMTDAQLLAHFQKTGGVACGRFTAEQLDRAIKTVEVPRSGWWTWVATGMLLALGLAKNVNAQYTDPKVPVEQGTIQQPEPMDSIGEFEIYGTLLDEIGNPIVNSNVEISEEGIIQAHTITDFDGKYLMRILKAGIYDIRFSYLGKETIITDVAVQKEKTKVCGTISNATPVLGAIKIIVTKKNKRKIPEPPGQKTHQAGDNLHPGY